jgi:outer membrane protein OmpA-like peptidoglycan-associated protein
MSKLYFSLAAILLMIGIQQNEKPPANRRNFVACPIIRDSKTMPCWLAEYDGELYYLGQQGRTSSAFYPPQLKHEVLVEGTVKPGERICGGIVLEPLSISVMPELSLNCNTLLPAEDGLEPPSPPPLPKNEPSQDSTRSFTILFDFDSDYLTLHKTRILGEAIRIAKIIQLKEIQVSAYRASTLLSNGQKMLETENIAVKRADKIMDILIGSGFPKERIKSSIKATPEPCDGLNDPARRRVLIKLLG